MESKAYHPHPPTHHTRTPGHTRRPTPHHSPASAVVVTVMATAPGRGSSEGASPTASVTALLRVPGGTEVSSFGIRERLIALTVHARRCVPVPYAGKKTPGGAGTHTGHTGHTGAGPVSSVSK